MDIWNTSLKLFRTKTDKILDNINLRRKASPQIPSQLTKTQGRVLQVIAERREVVGGSFAQKTLFPSSRKFQDIDIISKNPKETAEYLRKKIKVPTRAEMGRHGKYTIKHSVSGRVIADVVPSKYYKKYIRQYGDIPAYEVNGVRVLREDILFKEKKGAVRYGNPKHKQKLIDDLKFMSES
jgi:hypothetical protein